MKHKANCAIKWVRLSSIYSLSYQTRETWVLRIEYGGQVDHIPIYGTPVAENTKPHESNIPEITISFIGWSHSIGRVKKQ